MREPFGQERWPAVNLNPQKAEVILPGAVLYEAVLNQFGFDEMLISNRGLREGALLVGLTKADNRPHFSPAENCSPAAAEA